MQRKVNDKQKIQLLLPQFMEVVGGMKNNNTNLFNGIDKVLIVLIIVELSGTLMGYPL